MAARLLAVAVLLLAAAAGCKRAVPPPSGTRQTIEGFSLDQTADGERIWELKARAAVLQEDSGQAQLSLPRMEFYSKRRVVSRVNALSGLVRLDTHDVRLSSSVVLEALEEHAVMRTEELDYSAKRNLFTTEAEVLIERPEGRLRGKGLQAKPDLSEIRIFNQRSVVKEAPGI